MSKYDMVNSNHSETQFRYNPFILSALIYLLIGGLTGLYFGIASILGRPEIIHFVWTRVHFITIGTVLHILFGLLPQLINPEDETFRWETWILLNAGFILFLVGRLLYIDIILITGGTLMFLATLLFAYYLYKLTQEHGTWSFYSGELYYLTGFIFFLVGIIVGTGIWVGWSQYLAIAVPVEVHIHANNWGLISFVLVGLFLDLYPRWTGNEFKWPDTTKWIYVTMVLGALGLVIGPWIRSNWYAVPGLLFHFFATGLLLLNVILPLRDIKEYDKNILQLLAGYVWFFAPVFVAPLIVFKIGTVFTFNVEALAPEALVYGWLLSLALVLLLTMQQSTISPMTILQKIVIGLIHFGAILLWFSIFFTGLFTEFYGSAYTIWGIAILLGLTDLYLRRN